MSDDLELWQNNPVLNSKMCDLFAREGAPLSVATMTMLVLTARIINDVCHEQGREELKALFCSIVDGGANATPPTTH